MKNNHPTYNCDLQKPYQRDPLSPNLYSVWKTALLRKEAQSNWNARSKDNPTHKWNGKCSVILIWHLLIVLCCIQNNMDCEMLNWIVLKMIFLLLNRYKDRKLLYPGRHYRITMDEDVHTLTIHDAFQDDTGRYMCRAVNVVGSTTTEAYVKVQSKWTKNA